MAIYFDKSTSSFYLEGKDITYAFFINSYGYPEHLYFGERIHRDQLISLRTSSMVYTFNPSQCMAFPDSSEVKCLPAVQKIWVRSLGQEDSLREMQSTPVL